VRVDVGMWDHNLDVAKDYGDAIWNGIPAVVVLSADGKIVGSSADGSLANARAMTEEQVLGELAAWAP
jgi:thioredoxin 1